MSKAIRVSCEAADEADFRKIQPMQSAEFKTLTEAAYEKLRGLILKNGITAPIHVWKAKDGKLYNLDGHQRVRVLHQLEADGFKVPKVPVVFVKAVNVKQAKEILLSNVSQYGRVESQGLYEFVMENGINFEQLQAGFEIPNLDLKIFGEEFFDIGTKEVSFKAKKKSEEKQKMHDCPKCGHRF